MRMAAPSGSGPPRQNASTPANINATASGQTAAPYDVMAAFMELCMNKQARAAARMPRVELEDLPGSEDENDPEPGAQTFLDSPACGDEEDGETLSRWQAYHERFRGHDEEDARQLRGIPPLDFGYEEDPMEAHLELGGFPEATTLRPGRAHDPLVARTPDWYDPRHPHLRLFRNVTADGGDVLVIQRGLPGITAADLWNEDESRGSASSHDGSGDGDGNPPRDVCDPVGVGNLEQHLLQSELGGPGISRQHFALQDPVTGELRTMVDRARTDLTYWLSQLSLRDFIMMWIRFPGLGLFRQRNLLAQLVSKGLWRHVEFLLRQGADFACSWSWACTRNQPGIDWFLEQGADPNALIACQNIDMAAPLAQLLFHAAPCFPEMDDAIPYRDVLPVFSSYENVLPSVRALLRYGADPNLSRPEREPDPDFRSIPAYVDLRWMSRHGGITPVIQVLLTSAYDWPVAAEVLQLLFDAGGELCVEPHPTRPLPRCSLLQIMYLEPSKVAPACIDVLVRELGRRPFSTQDCCRGLGRSPGASGLRYDPRQPMEARAGMPGTAESSGHHPTDGVCLEWGLRACAINPSMVRLLTAVIAAGHPMSAELCEALLQGMTRLPDDTRNIPGLLKVVYSSSPQVQDERRQRSFTPAFEALRGATKMSSVMASLCLHAYMPEFRVRI